MLKLYKSIEKGNARFNKMTKMQKRVAIAEDVIASVRAFKFRAEPGTYFAMQNNDAITSDPQAIMQHEETVCNVCAIGAIFASKVKIGNKCTLNIDQKLGDRSIIPNIKSIFSEKELRIIEAAFERNAQDSIVPDDIEEKARKWHDKNHPMDDDKRLIAIMKNIIKNKGTFVL
jgi:hypothetical protein